MRKTFIKYFCAYQYVSNSLSIALDLWDKSKHEIVPSHFHGEGNEDLPT